MNKNSDCFLEMEFDEHVEHYFTGAKFDDHDGE